MFGLIPLWTTRTTVRVVREVEWDDDTRQAAYAFHQDKAERCPECGGIREECSDPETTYYPQLHRCYSTAARQRSVRMWEAKNQKTKPDRNGYKPDDGTSVWVSTMDLTPGDNFI